MKIEGLTCPFCECTKFTGYENSDSQATALYCDDCPAGMEDTGKTLQELIRLWRMWDQIRL